MQAFASACWARGAGKVEPRHSRARARVEAALRADPPDVVVVQDLGAPAYTSLRLRSLGLAFDQHVVRRVLPRDPALDHRREREGPRPPGALAVALLERASVELADAVVSPSVLPRRLDAGRGLAAARPDASSFRTCRVQGRPESRRPFAGRTTPGRVERIAFFGRLEERKGVGPFVEA